MDEFIAILRSQLPYYMVPTLIKEIERMHFTPNGKLDRAKTVDSISISVGRISDGSSLEYTRALNVIREIADSLELDGLLSDELLENTKINVLDSLAYIRLIVELETQFDMCFDDEFLARDSFETIGELCNYVVSNSNL